MAEEPIIELESGKKCLADTRAIITCWYCGKKDKYTFRQFQYINHSNNNPYCVVCNACNKINTISVQAMPEIFRNHLWNYDRIRIINIARQYPVDRFRKCKYRSKFYVGVATQGGCGVYYAYRRINPTLYQELNVPVIPYVLTIPDRCAIQ